MADDSGGPGGLSPSRRDGQYCELCRKMENLLRRSGCCNSCCSKEHQCQDWKKHKLVCQGSEDAVEPRDAHGQAWAPYHPHLNSVQPATVLPPKPSRRGPKRPRR